MAAGRAWGEIASAGTPADIVARIERLPVTAFHIKARVVVGTATLFDGYNASKHSDAHSSPRIYPASTNGSVEVIAARC